MSSDIAQKIGRGGAGNFYTKQDIEAASTRHQDLEAQNYPRDTSALIEAQSQHTGYLRSGRGGAGNFVDSSHQNPSLSSDVGFDPRAIEKDSSAAKGNLAESAIKERSAGYRGISGRGGAGNWVEAGDTELKRRQEEEQQLKSQVDERVRLDVELGLKPPPKAYAAQQNSYRGFK